MAWKSCQSGLEIQDIMAWKSWQIWHRNLSQFYLEIWANVAWKFQANLAWNPGQYGLESLDHNGLESPGQSGLEIQANITWKIRANMP